MTAATHQQKSEARLTRASLLNLLKLNLVPVAPSTAKLTGASLRTAAAAALFTRAGEVHGEIPAIQRCAIEGADRSLSLFRSAHGDETEPSRATAHTVGHQVGFQNGAMGGKGVLEIVFGGVEGKVSDKQFITHFRDVL